MPGAGQLNSIINITQDDDQQNMQTGETETEYKTAYTDIPAMKEDTAGGSRRRGLQVEDNVKAVFTIPFVAGISPRWRVEEITDADHKQTYEIVSTRALTDSRVWLELHCGGIA